MSTVWMVRHGQAQPGAQDEESYDNLSALGQDQARWLGDYVAASHNPVTRIVAGGLRRQQHTARLVARAMGLEPETDSRLNEIDYFGLSQSLHERHAIGLPDNREGFLLHLPEVMTAWSDGVIETPVERFGDYENRVAAALADAEAHPGTMLVTSGGIIAMAMRLVLSLDLEAFSHVLLQTHNSSLSRYDVEFGQRRLVTFNATPHLDMPGRETARTFV